MTHIDMFVTLGGFLKKETVSEIHLAADLLGVPIGETGFHDDDRWIFKAREFVLRKLDRKLSCISIGKDDMTCGCRRHALCLLLLNCIISYKMHYGKKYKLKEY